MSLTTWARKLFGSVLPLRGARRSAPSRGGTTRPLAVESLEDRSIPSVVSFSPSNATWYIRNQTSPGAPTVAPFAFGGPGWTPVMGDWDGNGTTTIGVVDPSTMTWYLKNSNGPGGPDITPFRFGAPGWIPVVGDWNGDGKTTIGVVDPTTETWYLRNSNTPGAPDITPFRYGAPGWVPVVGDWTGSGKSTVGVVDPSTETWYLRNTNSPGGPDIAPFAYGGAGWRPVVGDWDGNGTTTVGVVDPSGKWYVRNRNSGGGTDVAPFAYGAPGWEPLADARVALPPPVQTPPPPPQRFTLVEAPPLDDTTRGSGFSLTSGPQFDASHMQLGATRTVGDITFRFYNDKPAVTTWTAAQVNVIMQAVSELDGWTDNNHQLLVDPKYGKQFNFVKTDESRLVQMIGKSPAAGTLWNGLNSDQGNGRFIAFLDWDVTDASANAEENRTVKHEIGHNFDSSAEKAQALERRYPNLGLGEIQLVAFFHWQWIGESGWVPNPAFALNDGEIADRSAWVSLFGRPTNQLTPSGDGNWYYKTGLPNGDFARDYSRYSPYEDWSTTLEVYSDIVNGGLRNSWQTQYAGLTNKLKLVDLFFSVMGNDGQGNIFSKSDLLAFYNNAYTTATGYQGLKAP